MITSTANPTVKRLMRLHERRGRTEQKAYLIEGVRLVEEALDRGVIPETIVTAPDVLRATARGRALHERLTYQYGLPAPIEVSPAVLRHLAATETPSGVIAVLPRRPVVSPDDLPRSSVLAVVLDGIADPGNAGTILRSSAAAGVDAVIALAGCTDLYAPKVVRAAMGAHLRLPLAVDVQADHLPLWLDGYGQVVLADAHAGDTIYQTDLRGPTALIVGGEAHGAVQSSRLPGVRRVAIPMPGGIESLNAAVAASVILFEAVRQRMSGWKS